MVIPMIFYEFKKRDNLFLNNNNSQSSSLPSIEEVQKRENRNEEIKRNLLIKRYDNVAENKNREVKYQLKFVNKLNLHAEYQKLDCEMEVQLFGDIYYSPIMQLSFTDQKIKKNGKIQVEFQTSDVGNITMIYLCNKSTNLDFYIEICEISNQSSFQYWKIPIYSFFGSNTSNCKLSSLLWVYSIEEEDGDGVIEVIDSEVSKVYDPILTKFIYKYELTLRSGSYKWKINRRESEFSEFAEIFSGLTNLRSSPSSELKAPPKMNNFLPSSRFLSFLSNKKKLSKLIKIRLNHFIDDLKKNHLFIMNSLQFRAFFHIPPNKIRLGITQLGGSSRT